MTRQPIVAGNWKMNKNYEEGRELAKEIAGNMKPSNTLLILAPPFIHLYNVSNIIKDINNISLAAQNCHQEESGAYTGEISVPMLKSVSVEYVIIGHSERREYFGEDDKLLAEKVRAVIDHGLKPIFCCGEKLDVRREEQHEELVRSQIKAGLFHLSPEEFKDVIIAYEPVWAIGTGETASPEQAQDMHGFIRGLVEKQYGIEQAEQVRILYGGSVKPGNAEELFSQPDVDGGLIGGASLKAEDFLAIAGSF